MFPKHRVKLEWNEIKKKKTFLYHNFATLWMPFIVLHGSWYDTANLKDGIYIHRFLKLLLRHLNKLPGHLYEWGLVYSTSFPMTAVIGSSSFLWPWIQVGKKWIGIEGYLYTFKKKMSLVYPKYVMKKMYSCCTAMCQWHSKSSGHPLLHVPLC